MHSHEFKWIAGQPLDPELLRSSLSTAGFAVVRDVLSKEEVNAAREEALDYLTKHGARFGLGRTQPNASMAIPKLATIFAHERIIAILNCALGEGNVAFTGHSDVHMNMLSGWHKDSGETFGGYFRGDYFSADDCRVFKVALYLQDADEWSALRVRYGSHRSASLQEGKEISIRTHAGDAILFDVRLTHTGQTPDKVETLIKALNVLATRNDRTKQDSRFASALRTIYARAVGRKDRLSVFFTFGYPNAHTHDFSVRNRARQDMQSLVRENRFPDDLRERLTTLGVGIVDLDSPGVGSRPGPTERETA